MFVWLSILYLTSFFSYVVFMIILQKSLFSTNTFLYHNLFHHFPSAQNPKHLNCGELLVPEVLPETWHPLAKPVLPLQPGKSGQAWQPPLPSRPSFPSSRTLVTGSLPPWGLAVWSLLVQPPRSLFHIKSHKDLQIFVAFYVKYGSGGPAAPVSQSL